MLTGHTAYVDVFTPDAPMMLIVSLAPAKLAQVFNLTGYSLARCALVFEWLLATAMLALSASLILRRSRLQDSLSLQIFLLTLGFLNVAATYQFAEPEHYFMLTFIPFAIARWLEYSGRSLRPWECIICGIAGGIAATLDPLFATALFVWEVALLLQFTRLSVKVAGVLPLSVITYIALQIGLNTFAAQMMHGYISNVLPIINWDRISFDIRMYGFFSTPDARPSLYLLILSTILALALRYRNSLMTPLTVLGWTAFAFFVTECKGYLHNALPIFWTSSLTISLVLITLLSDLHRAIRRAQKRYRRSQTLEFAGRLKPAMLAAFVLTTCTLSTLLVQEKQMVVAKNASRDLRGFELTDIPDIAELIAEKTQKGDSVLVFDNGPAPAFPAITLQERKPGSRILWGFHIPVLERSQWVPGVNGKERERLEKFYDDILRDDLKENPPQLITIQDGATYDELKRMGTMKLIEDHYAFMGESNYFSANDPPKEFANYSYVSKVFLFAF